MPSVAEQVTALQDVLKLLIKKSKTSLMKLKLIKLSLNLLKKSDMLTMLRPMMGLSPKLIDGVGQM